MVRQGGILAIKGLGGFQLWVDASCEQAVERLRERKHRPRKPFAVLFPSLEVLQEHCHLSSEEQALLTSPPAPIVLLQRKVRCTLAPLVAPDNPYLGAMLPYTPMHHLLMANLKMPVVATSGNRSEDPIVINEHEALAVRLNGIADAYLVHNRPIARPVDDSVLRVINGKTRHGSPSPRLCSGTHHDQDPGIPKKGTMFHSRSWWTFQKHHSGDDTGSSDYESTYR